MKISIFDSIKHVDENGSEYWLARELQKVLGYTEWRNFEKILFKSKQACKNSNIPLFNHFVGFNKMVNIGSKTKRETKDYKLSRYACYLIVMNGDPRKDWR